MNEQRLKKISKFLSLILRHHLEKIDIQLDKEGFADIDVLLKNINKKQALHFLLLREQLEKVVATNDKKRFEISADGLKIRAVQGHSTAQVERTFVAKIPPNPLYHGTAEHFLPSILADGLLPQSRHLVHLSADIETAKKVGRRHGKIAILQIDTETMLKNGFEFYQAENGVWLVKNVPTEYLTQLQNF